MALPVKKYADISAFQHLIAVHSDADAFRQLHAIMAKRLYQFANAITKNESDAEDIVADVFLKIWEKRHTLDQIENLELYLFVATRNRAINAYKKKKSQNTLPLSGDDMVLTEHLGDIAEHADLEAAMQQAIFDLPPRCKAVFILVRQYGLRHKEVASILHLSPKTVENQMAIALKKLGSYFFQLQHQ